MSLSAYNTELCPGRDMDVSIAVPVWFRANIASGTKTSPPSQFKTIKPGQYYPIETSWEEIKIDQKIPVLENLNAKINSLDSRIIKSRASIRDNTSYILFANSDGIMTYDYRPHTGLGSSCSADNNGQIEEGYWGLAVRDGFD